jgi:hypothetical protein
MRGARGTTALAHTGLEQLGHLAERGGAVPVRRFDIIEACGSVTHFAGTGWYAELIDDFHAQKTGLGVVPKRMRKGLVGYLQCLFTRRIPRHLHLLHPPSPCGSIAATRMTHSRWPYDTRRKVHEVNDAQRHLGLEPRLEMH